MYIYISTHIYALYVLYLYIIYIIYKYKYFIYVYKSNIFLNICLCVYIIYIVHTHICKHKLLFWMRLIVLQPNSSKLCQIPLFSAFYIEFHFYDWNPQFCSGFQHHGNHMARDITRFTTMTSEKVFQPFLLQNVVQEACNSSEHKTQPVEERVWFQINKHRKTFALRVRDWLIWPIYSFCGV